MKFYRRNIREQEPTRDILLSLQLCYHFPKVCSRLFKVKINVVILVYEFFYEMIKRTQLPMEQKMQLHKTCQKDVQAFHQNEENVKKYRFHSRWVQSKPMRRIFECWLCWMEDSPPLEPFQRFCSSWLFVEEDTLISWEPLQQIPEHSWGY